MPSAGVSVPPPSGGQLDRGQPGASLAREYERRRSNRERATRQAHPRFGGLLLVLGDTPQHEAAFRRGGLGEKAVAESLEKRTAESPVVVLHNRRMPGGRGDVDHLAIAPSGVVVIDTKDVRGKVRVNRSWFGEPKLLIDGRDRTSFIDGLDRQVRAVRGALDATGNNGVPVQGVLCFTRADLPLLGTLQIRSHQLLYRKALAKRLNAAGPLAQTAIDSIARALAQTLPPA